MNPAGFLILFWLGWNWAWEEQRQEEEEDCDTLRLQKCDSTYASLHTHAAAKPFKRVARTAWATVGNSTADLRSPEGLVAAATPSLVWTIQRFAAAERRTALAQNELHQLWIGSKHTIRGFERDHLRLEGLGGQTRRWREVGTLRGDKLAVTWPDRVSDCCFWE